MEESMTTMNRLLQEVAVHLRSKSKTEQSAAFDKLRRIAAIAETLSLTLKMAR